MPAPPLGDVVLLALTMPVISSIKHDCSYPCVQLFNVLLHCRQDHLPVLGTEALCVLTDAIWINGGRVFADHLDLLLKIVGCPQLKDTPEPAVEIFSLIPHCDHTGATLVQGEIEGALMDGGAQKLIELLRAPGLRVCQETNPQTILELQRRFEKVSAKRLNALGPGMRYKVLARDALGILHDRPATVAIESGGFDDIFYDCISVWIFNREFVTNGPAKLIQLRKGNAPLLRRNTLLGLATWLPCNICHIDQHPCWPKDAGVGSLHVVDHL
jgi:hypothetical protein